MHGNNFNKASGLFICMTIDDGNAEANMKTDKAVRKRGQVKKTGESSKENKPIKNDVLKKDKLLRAREVRLAQLLNYSA